MIQDWEIAQATESAAIAASHWIGKGDETSADQAAVDAMRSCLNKLDIQGRIVIGEGERDQAPMLYMGEKVGTGIGPEVDIAVDPLEGTALCAKGLPNAISVIAMGPKGSLLQAPDVYMKKIAIGPEIPQTAIDLHLPASKNIRSIAKAKKVSPEKITVCILDRVRHELIIEDIRTTGASIRLISDGDVAAVMHTARSEETGIDLYLGIGGAPEGVLASAALKCLGGSFQGQLIIQNVSESSRAKKAGIKNNMKTYSLTDLVQEHIIFAATGITDGSLLKGIRKESFQKSQKVHTETLLLNSATESVKRIYSENKIL